MATVPPYTDGTTPHAADLAWWQQTPRVRVYNSTGPSLTTGTVTLLSWDTEEVNNIQGDAMHSTVTNPSRLIAVTAGRYLVTASIGFASNATNARNLMIRKNAAGSGTGGVQMINNYVAAVASNNLAVTATFSTLLAANDYLEVFAYQNSGGALSVNAGQWSTYAEMIWIGTA